MLWRLVRGRPLTWLGVAAIAAILAATAFATVAAARNVDREAQAERDALLAQTRGSIAGPPDARQIDTWIAIHADNTATVYVGFAELGQGTSTALLQIAADELDLGMDQIRSVRLDTHVTPNQGGTYSSASIARGGPQIRTAAAEARFALLEMASQRLDVPAASLSVSPISSPAESPSGGP